MYLRKLDESPLDSLAKWWWASKFQFWCHSRKFQSETRVPQHIACNFLQVLSREISSKTHFKPDFRALCSRVKKLSSKPFVHTVYSRTTKKICSKKIIPRIIKFERQSSRANSIPSPSSVWSTPHPITDNPMYRRSLLPRLLFNHSYPKSPSLHSLKQ